MQTKAGYNIIRLTYYYDNLGGFMGTRLKKIISTLLYVKNL